MYFTVCPYCQITKRAKRKNLISSCVLLPILHTSTIKVRTTYRCFSSPEQDYFLDLVLRIVFSEHTSDCEGKPVLLIKTRHPETNKPKYLYDHPVLQQSTHPQTAADSSRFKETIVRSTTVKKAKERLF